jgi:nucleoside-diphosphate-sugar epimerase
MLGLQGLHMTVLVTGAAGFLGSYIVKELVEAGHKVLGIDNFWRFGSARTKRSDDPRYRLVNGDAKDISLLIQLLSGVDHFVVNAALHGGVSYLSTAPYDIIAENSRITAAAFDAALEGFRSGWLRRIHLVSSASVFENAGSWPAVEGDQLQCPPPKSSYGLQKLEMEYFARSAWEQHGLPFTIIRPSNCIGSGPGALAYGRPARQVLDKQGTQNVVIDLVCEALRCRETGEPFRLIGDGNQVRQFTHASDIATGIRLCIEKNAAINEDFNLAANEPTTIRELAQLIWDRINPGVPIRFVFQQAPRRDVRHRHVDTTKAARLLGFQPRITLPQIVSEMTSFVEDLVESGQLAVC